MTLNLTESFLLLALDSNKGKFLIDSIALNYGLAGAALMKLTILNKIQIRDRKVVVIDHSLTGTQYFDEVLGMIRSSQKQRTVKYWVNRLGNRLKKLKYKVIGKLIMQGVLKEEKRKFLGIIPYKVYPATNRVPKEELRGKMLRMIRGVESIDAKHLMLLSLLESTKLTRVLFDSRAEYKKWRKSVKELVKEFEVSDVVHTTIREVCATVVAASTSATVSASAGGPS